ncbi:hypothetical protein IXB28_11330 [Leptothoe kymatousa TAU-MAC 1615]|uniref:Trypsin-co-occurring domain-containing protein n=2 Tax=Leptothoe TaxID=2651725 RepID=A0ABS5Y4T5_9CYAN|nr:hypothetical protein [Leptothoe kymatousa TAU-MAC 1615]
MGKVKPFRLDDNTIIYVQSNEDIDTTELTQSIENNDLEDDPALPGSTSPSSDTDEEVEEYGRVSKGWQYPNRHGTSRSNDSAEQPATAPQNTPAQRVGTLVKAYTTHLIKDIRDTALTDVEVEKVVLEFGIGLDTTAQIPYIASSSVECSVKVAIECKLTPPSSD